MKKRLLFLLFCLVSVHLFGQQNIYEIYAFEFEKIDWRPLVSEIAVGATTKDTLQGTAAIWLLKGNNGKTILVDAGYINQDHPKTYMRPDSVLRKLNIRPEDITDIVLTHPHWDHIGGINLFPKAMVWMQEDVITILLELHGSLKALKTD